MKAWFWKLLAAVLSGPAAMRIRSLEDQVAAQRQTIRALKIEWGRILGDYDNLLDRHEELQGLHRELEKKYAARSQPNSASWMLGQAAERAQA